MWLLPRNAELEALLELRQSVDLAFLGCAFHRGLAGSITISLGRSALGAWWFENGAYHFATTAYRARPEYTVRTVGGVVAATHEIASKHAMYLSYQEHGIAVRAGERPMPQGYTIWNH